MCRGGSGGLAHRVQLSDRRLHVWLTARGLHPAKSLTLGALDVASGYIRHVVRGLLDGDGSIYTRRQRPTRRLAPDYWYERIWTYFASASLAHVMWLGPQLEAEFGVQPWLERTVRRGRPFYRLRLGKRDSLQLLGMIYADASWPALARKRQKWVTYMEVLRSAEGGI